MGGRKNCNSPPPMRRVSCICGGAICGGSRPLRRGRKELSPPPPMKLVGDICGRPIYTTGRLWMTDIHGVETCDDMVDKWHDGDSDKTLQEYLGLDDEQYQDFVVGRNIPEKK